MDKQSFVLKGQPNNIEDYTNSSNSLFHFMKNPEYLYHAITNKALIPRYCKEDIKYLNLSLNHVPFNEMAVLMKCFCDIPLHRITKYTVSSQKKQKCYSDLRKYSHTSLYGEYALAFSKSWGEQQGIQPITYLNTTSVYFSELSKTIKHAISGDEQIPDIVANNYLLQLAFYKPLRGSMLRYNKDNRKPDNIIKNFYDEQEWRFIPPASFNEESIFEPIIANPLILNDINKLSDSPIQLMSKKLCESTFQEYWLKFDYDDIRYIIVSNKQDRLDFINYILNLDVPSNMERYILISKVLVLDEIRKDW